MILLMILMIDASLSIVSKEGRHYGFHFRLLSAASLLLAAHQAFYLIAALYSCEIA